MDELLTPEQRDLKNRAREVAEKYVRPQAAELDRTGEYPYKIMEKIIEWEYGFQKNMAVKVWAFWNYVWWLKSSAKHAVALELVTLSMHWDPFQS
jgi:hypothetical protein